MHSSYIPVLGPNLKKIVNEFINAPKTEGNDKFRRQLWRHNSLLQEWFAGEKMNWGSITAPDIRTISFDDLSSQFKLALSCLDVFLVKLMWNSNPKLRAWFCGHEVDFGTTTQPNKQKISEEELITHFKSSLTIRIDQIIENIWFKNDALKSAIKKLNLESSKALLYKVFSINKVSYNNFIQEYMSTVDNVDLLKNMLQESNALAYQMSQSTMNKKLLLHFRLTQLNASVEPQKSSSPVRNPRKRKAAVAQPIDDNAPLIKASVETAPLAWTAYLPHPDLVKTTMSFLIDLKKGETLLIEAGPFFSLMGIKNISKRVEASVYYIEVNDIQMYTNFWEMHNLAAQQTELPAIMSPPQVMQVAYAPTFFNPSIRFPAINPTLNLPVPEVDETQINYSNDTIVLNQNEPEQSTHAPFSMEIMPLSAQQEGPLLPLQDCFSLGDVEYPLEFLNSVPTEQESLPEELGFRF